MPATPFRIPFTMGLRPPLPRRFLGAPLGVGLRPLFLLGLRPPLLGSINGQAIWFCCAPFSMFWTKSVPRLRGLRVRLARALHEALQLALVPADHLHQLRDAGRHGLPFSAELPGLCCPVARQLPDHLGPARALVSEEAPGAKAACFKPAGRHRPDSAHATVDDVRHGPRQTRTQLPLQQGHRAIPPAHPRSPAAQAPPGSRFGQKRP